MWIRFGLLRIREIRKIGRLGREAKLFAGWTLRPEIADGLEITDREGNKLPLPGITLQGHVQTFHKMAPKKKKNQSQSSSKRYHSLPKENKILCFSYVIIEDICLNMTGFSFRVDVIE